LIVNAVRIAQKIKEKIETKHAITLVEIERVILEDDPKFRRVKGCYMAIGIWKRYLTMFFTYNENNKEVDIITAYPSSKWQIKMWSGLK
jgi:hypothetical protein